MNNHDFRELVDQNLSGLVWDEQKRQRVLRAIKEEEKPVRKISSSFVLAAAIVCLAVTALAAGLVFSGSFDAVKIAEKTIYDTYGVSGDMLSTFFGRSVEEKTNGGFKVVYSGTDTMHYVLGEYTVEIKGNKGYAEWSHDGESTSGMFEADAWGVEQLQEMMRLSAEKHEVTEFAMQAKMIAERHGTEADSKSRNIGNGYSGKEEAMAAARAAGRTEEDLYLLAREAVISAYDLTPEQGDMLLSVSEIGLDVDEYEDFAFFHMADGKPIYTTMISLHQQTSDNPDEFPLFTEKDGVYWVDVNVETGVIENILYDTQLGGNG